MQIINYNSIRHKIKRYSTNVDFNMSRAGWLQIAIYEDVIGQKSVDLVRNYHVAVGNLDNTEYCYRRFTGAWGLPLLIVYVKETIT